MTSAALFLEFTPAALRIHDGTQGFSVALERLENGSLSPACRQRLPLTLQGFLGKTSRQTHRRAFCAINARGVSLRRLTLPPASKDELHRLLALQVEREFPLAPEELAWGSLPLQRNGAVPNGNTGPQEFVVAAIKRNILSEYHELLVACDLSPVFTVGALARATLCLESTASGAVLDLGPREAELLSFEDHTPLDLRVIRWGTKHLIETLAQRLGLSAQETEERMRRRDLLLDPLGTAYHEVWQAEAASLAEALRSHWHGTHLFLSGAIVRQPAFVSALGESLGGGVRGQPLPVPVEGDRSAGIHGLQRLAAGQGQTAPLVLKWDRGAGPERLPLAARWKWAIAAAVLALILVSLRYGEAFVGSARLTRQFARLEPVRTRLPAIDKELSFLLYLKENQAPYLDALFVIGNAVNPGTQIESLSMNRDGQVSLRGLLQNPQQAVAFRSNLVSSGFFSNVVVEEQTPAPDHRRTSIRMTAQWKPEATRKLPKARPRPKHPAFAPGMMPHGALPPGAIMRTGPPPNAIHHGPMPQGMPATRAMPSRVITVHGPPTGGMSPAMMQRYGISTAPPSSSGSPHP